MAHVRMLSRAGLIKEELEQNAISALNKAALDIEDGNYILEEVDQDLYLALDRMLHEHIGESALLLRRGRSRNDHLATDIRLFLRDGCLHLFNRLFDLQLQILELAREHIDISMPGYSNMQPTSPMLLSHWWMASSGRFKRDAERLRRVFESTNLCPMGAGAFSGASEQIERHYLAELLFFDGIIENSHDAVCDRDYLIEFFSFASIFSMHVSQLVTELLLWTTQEFGFARLPRDIALQSGSRIPNSNSEILEILRSRSSMISCRLSQILSELKAIPISYTYDLEVSLPAVLDVDSELHYQLELLMAILPRIIFDGARMGEQAIKELSGAGGAVDFLIDKGVAPTQARIIVDRLLQYCRQRQKSLADLAPTEWHQFSPAFDNEIYNYVANETTSSIDDNYPGTSQEQVTAAIERAALALRSSRDWLSSASEKIKSCSKQ